MKKEIVQKFMSTREMSPSNCLFFMPLTYETFLKMSLNAVSEVLGYTSCAPLSQILFGMNGFSSQGQPLSQVLVLSPARLIRSFLWGGSNKLCRIHIATGLY